MFTDFIAEHGYLTVFIGSVLEGETVLVLAGFAAHQGYLSFLPIVAFGLLGGWLGDMFFFLLGRRHGSALLGRYPQWHSRVQKVNRWLLRYQAGAIIGVRFMYGLRVAGPIAIGMSDIPVWRFVVLNLAGSTVWAITFTAAGFLFGHTMQWIFADIKRYEDAALLCIAAVAVALMLYRHLRTRAARAS